MDRPSPHPLRIGRGDPVNSRLLTEIWSYMSVTNDIIDAVVYGSEQNKTFDALAAFVDAYPGRLAGSEILERSIDYMVQLLEGQMFDAVYTEPVQVPSWVRGSEEAWMTKPQSKRLAILGLGGSIGTPPGGLTAPVFVVSSFEELERNSSQAKGKIVVFNQKYRGYAKSVAYRFGGASAAARAGAIAALVRSVTPLSINSPHTGMMQYDDNVTKIPAASITVEDAELLARLQGRGVNPVVKLVMNAKTLPPDMSRNIIAEIRGREKPDEIVLVSGHLDSWDVGQGAMDDASGAFVSWRALAVLRQLGLRPRRTLRCVLWTDEEQATSGAKEHFRRHFESERRLVNLVMESDSGTFRPLGLGFSATNKWALCMAAEVVTLFAPINASQLTLGAKVSDLTPWVKRGIPAASLTTANEKYFYFHHSEGDTMSVLDRHELDLCTALWAAAAYVFAELSERLPR
ncbi:carboxypeptidase Q-like [Haemaphysalis longicornis]